MSTSASLEVQQKTSAEGRYKPKISLIMPAYNEEDCILQSVERAKSVLESLEFDYEIVVVDDGSKDRTRELVLLNCNDDHVKVVGYDKNMGKGYAIKYGFLHSNGDTVVFLDSDLDIDVSILGRCVSLLNDADIVIASKRHPHSQVKVPFKRWFLSYAFHAVVKLLTGVKVTDTQAGLKAFRSSALKKVFRLVLSKKFAFDVEILCVSSLLKLRIAEMPVHLALTNSFSLRNISRIMLDILGIGYRFRILKWYQRSLTSPLPTYKPLVDPK